MIERYRHYLKLTDDPTAAAILAVGEQLTKPEALLDVKQAAERLGVSVDLVRDMVNDKRLPSIKIGRAIRIAPTDLERFAA